MNVKDTSLKELAMISQEHDYYKIIVSHTRKESKLNRMQGHPTGPDAVSTNSPFI